MREAVHRQRELRRRLLHAAYSALLKDPDGFMDVGSVSGEADGGGGPPSELRAAAYYLVERGLLFMMPPAALAKHGLDPDDLYVHVTARGVDAFEEVVLASEARVSARPIGFRIGPSSPADARAAQAARVSQPEPTPELT